MPFRRPPRPPRPPLTAAGLAVAVSVVVAYPSGWLLGWIEMMVLAAAGLAALVLGCGFVAGRLRLATDRSVSAERVVAGEPVTATLTLTNDRPFRSRSLRLEEQLTDDVRQFVVPALGRGDSSTYSYEVPTARRGLLDIGPALLTRGDPLHLLRRQAVQRTADQLWVHPRHRPLPAMPAGFAKDLEGPTTDSSPDGDVAFHTLRDYQPGDDHRHIHWMSTARAGRPIIRHYVDNRRPELLVLLDTRPDAMARPEFEVAVEVAASIGVSAVLHNEPISVWTGQGPVLGQTRPGGRNDLLDRLSLVDQVDLTADGSSGEIEQLVAATILGVRTEPGPSVVVLVTGAAEPEAMNAYATRVNRQVKVIAVRVWPIGEVVFGQVPGVTVLDVDSLLGFQRFWTDLIT